MFSSFKTMRASGQLLFALFVLMICALLGTMVSYLGSAALYGGFHAVNELYATQDFTSSSYISLLRFSQVVQSVFLFGVTPFVLAYLYAEHPKQYLYLDQKPRLITILWGLGILLCVSPFVNLSGLLNEQIKLPESLGSVERWMKSSEDFAHFVVQKMVDDSGASAWVNYVVIAVIPALVEELLFRGALQRLSIKLTKNVHWGIWLSAAVFSAIHMQFYGFIPRMLLGALFGYLVYYSGSLWISIGLHFLNNTLALRFEFYGANDLQSLSFFFPETMGDVSIGYVIAATVGLLATLFLFQQLQKHRKKTENN